MYFKIPYHLAIGSSGRGRLKFFDDIKRYGFIETDDGIDLFVHETGMAEVPYHLRVRDMDVEYTVANDVRFPDRLKAENVRVIKR